MSSYYYLSEHVHLCVTPSATVLLDLRADRYIGLDGAQTRVLASVMHGWPGTLEAAATDESEGGADLLRDLLSRGVLTQDASRGKRPSTVRLPEPQARLDGWRSPQWSAVTFTDVRRMAAAYARALFLLKVRSLEQAVGHVARRKSSRGMQAVSDLELARATTNKFRTLRPFFYTARDKCLLDSLVLIEYLAAYRIYPSWVIGVTMNPFAAHSWIQLQSYVLNGPLAYAREFQPILSV